MLSNQISAFEYVSILVSIILGLGITQILSVVSDLVFDTPKVKFYFPHTVWVMFLLFLHIQDWFISYQLKDIPVWYLPELFFILSYPVLLFVLSKVITPQEDDVDRTDLKVYYYRRYPTIFGLMSGSVLLSILFNAYLLKLSLLDQWPLAVFLALLLGLMRFKTQKESVHIAFASLLILGVGAAIWLERFNWVIR
jgi:hypothetical protein